MVDLRLHDAGDLAVPFGTAPHHRFRPQGMLAQLMDCRMIVTLDLIGQRQIARIEYAHLGAEQDEQAGRLLHRKPAERTRAQRTIAQPDTRRWIARTKRSEEHTSELQ